MSTIDPPEIHRLRLRRGLAKRNLIFAVTAIVTMVGAAIVIPLVVLAFSTPEAAGGAAALMAVFAAVTTFVASFIAFDQYSDFQRYDVDLKTELHRAEWKEHKARQAQVDQIIREEWGAAERAAFDDAVDYPRHMIKKWQDVVRHLERRDRL